MRLLCREGVVQTWVPFTGVTDLRVLHPCSVNVVCLHAWSPLFCATQYGEVCGAFRIASAMVLLSIAVFRATPAPYFSN